MPTLGDTRKHPSKDVMRCRHIDQDVGRFRFEKQLTFNDVIDDQRDLHRICSREPAPSDRISSGSDGRRSVSARYPHRIGAQAPAGLAARTQFAHSRVKHHGGRGIATQVLSPQCGIVGNERNVVRRAAPKIDHLLGRHDTRIDQKLSPSRDFHIEPAQVHGRVGGDGAIDLPADDGLEVFRRRSVAGPDVNPRHPT